MKDIVIKNCRVGFVSETTRKVEESGIEAENLLSFVSNCVIFPRGDEFLFSIVKGEVVVRLNGYVIMPIEEYQRRHGELE